MPIQPFQIPPTPFSEQADPEVFFPGGRREEFCQSLILDILAGKKLIKLVGREGSGKTMLCQMVADRLTAAYQVIMPASPFDCLDDLVQAMCFELGMNPLIKPVDPFKRLPRLLERRTAEQIKIVLIIDEAEKLSLATLNDLLLYISESTEKLAWTTLLVGGPSLENILAQLSVLCSTVDIHAGYFLEGLTASQTRQYLRFRLMSAGLPREQSAEIFDEETVDRIIAESRGNIRQVNLLAQEVFKTLYPHKPIEQAPVTVQPEPIKKEANTASVEDKIFEIWDLLRENRWLAGAVVGTVLVVLLAGFLLSTGGSHGDAALPAQNNHKTANILAPKTNQEAAQATIPPKTVEIRDGERLFRERLAASSKWLTGLHKGKFTIVLMTVGSHQGQTNIAKLLIQDDFFQILDQLYIFRKKTNPPTIFVYLGLYDSLDAARETRNNLPIALRRQHPYPLAVTDALKKLDN